MTSAGPLSAGIGTNNAAAGTVAWANPGNIVSSNDSRAVAAHAGGDISQNLEATNFGFSIPAGATIDGIVVEREESASVPDAVKDNRVVLLKAGATHGGDKARGVFWGTSDSYISFGGASDVWSGTWTAADINHSGFGVQFRSTTLTSGLASDARVDHVRITVYYTEAGTPFRRSLLGVGF